jgi:hypothetical protein
LSKRAIEAQQVVRFVTDLLNPGMHYKRALSIGQAVVGVMHCVRLSSASVGRALAAEFGITAKAGIKQVDRLLGNRKFDLAAGFRLTVPWLVADRREIVVSLDWTEYGAQGHSRIALNLVTSHGRATPLVWMTVLSKNLKGRQTGFEDRALWLLKSVLPPGVDVIILADRGFADVSLFEHIMENLDWSFVIRFRGKTHVESASGERRMCSDWVPKKGKLLKLEGALVTAQRIPTNVVCVQQPAMKDAWCLATDLSNARRVVKLYGQRFTCEETFRDEKDPRFGLGSRELIATTTERRDRFLFIAMLATALLTLLGGAGEQIGCDRALKANTSKSRSHSLFRQGREYLRGCVGNALRELRATFQELLRRHPRQTET